MSAAPEGTCSPDTGVGPSFWLNSTIFQSPFTQLSRIVVVFQASTTGLMELLPTRPTMPTLHTSTVAEVAVCALDLVPIGTARHTNVSPFGAVPSAWRPKVD